MRRIGRKGRSNGDLVACIQILRQGRLFHFCLGVQKCSVFPQVRGVYSGLEACKDRMKKWVANQKSGPTVVQVRHIAKNFPMAKAFGKFRYVSTSASLSLCPSTLDKKSTKCLWYSYLTLLLMTIFAQTLLAFVGSNFVSFTFFSARHTASNVMSYEL